MQQHPAWPGDPLNPGEEISHLQQDPRLFRCQYMQAEEEDKAGEEWHRGSRRESEGQNAGSSIVFGVTKILRQKQSGWLDCKQQIVNKYFNATYSYVWVGIKPRYSYDNIRGIRGQLVQKEVRAGLEEARYYRNYRRQSQNTTRTNKEAFWQLTIKGGPWVPVRLDIMRPLSGRAVQYVSKQQSTQRDSIEVGC